MYCDLCSTSLRLWKDVFFFVGPLFFGVCGVLFNVLSRSVLSVFRRGSLDTTVWRSVNFGACMVRVLSMSSFVYCIVVYAECRHIQFLCSHLEFLV